MFRPRQVESVPAPETKMKSLAHQLAQLGMPPTGSLSRALGAVALKDQHRLAQARRVPSLFQEMQRWLSLGHANAHDGLRRRALATPAWNRCEPVTVALRGDEMETPEPR